MNYTVIGAGKSGIAAAVLAVHKGHNVFLTESKPSTGFEDAIKILESNGVDYEFGGNTERALEFADRVITCPGVLPSTNIIKSAEEKGIEIISELEFARSFVKDNPLIAITGTNGKTTTTTLISHILKNAGKKIITAGNIGTPLSEFVETIDKDTIIITEVSSFQLDRTKDFRPDVAIILNITPDHLYYHGNMKSYIEAKFKIASNQVSDDILIINADDENISRTPLKCKSIIQEFSMEKEVENGAFNNNGALIVKLKGNKEEIILLKDISIPGTHNAYNSMAAVLAARAFEVRNENIRDALMSFAGVEHRLEYVRTLDNVEYVNDSKATNINATWYALSSYTKPIVWIAGGRGDNNDYSALDNLVKKNVKAVISMGEESESIFNHFCTMKRVVKAGDMADAINKARAEAQEGDIILFTPACKSFDMFCNFEQRGEVFKQCVNSLI